MSEYTKGPWYLDGRTVYAIDQDNGRRRFYADIYPVEWKNIAEATANARLCQVAPDLLEALENLTNAIAVHEMLGRTDLSRASMKSYIEAEAAIKKARGER